MIKSDLDIQDEIEAAIKVMGDWCELSQLRIVVNIKNGKKIKQPGYITKHDVQAAVSEMIDQGRVIKKGRLYNLS